MTCCRMFDVMLLLGCCLHIQKLSHLVPDAVVNKECTFEEEELTNDSNEQDWKGFSKTINVSEASMKDLSQIYDISNDEAVHMVHISQCPQVSDKNMRKTLYFLKDHGITSQQLQRIPWILLHSSGILQEKFKKLLEPHLFQNFSDGLGFCYFPVKKIAVYQKKFKLEAADFPNHPNRIYYLAERLKVPVELLTEKIVRPHEMLSTRIKRLDCMIDMFYNYGMKSEDILADLWVFNHGAKKAEKRLKIATELGCHAPKPWMCRCSAYIFERYCERVHTRNVLLGDHKDSASYMAARLQCEKWVIDRLFKSNFLLKKINIEKLKRILDLLFSEGVSPEAVRSNMKVFQYSETRTADRIKELKEIGFYPFPMYLLSRTPGQFRNIINKFKTQHGLIITEEEEEKEV
ncbi:uncharacterized protein [Cherax quadricarinatus]|uniref:uncharacterized protein isoform X2 n=1 Tax=Cherax quadricarinatus TaxID=27406 RepID=UPI00387E5120